MTVPVAEFAPKSMVRIIVRNQQSLAAASQGAECIVGFSAPNAPATPCPKGYTCTTNPTNPQESMVCPAGVQPRFGPVPQEVLQVPVAPEITVTAHSLVQGEPFEISVSGRSNDDCNSVNGSVVKGTLQGDTLSVVPADWMTTMMACAPTPMKP
ncbi:MAG: hypothetical protein U0271_05460 [Polyangiaceae bacterium]